MKTSTIPLHDLLTGPGVYITIATLVVLFVGMLVLILLRRKFFRSGSTE